MLTYLSQPAHGVLRTSSSDPELSRRGFVEEEDACNSDDDVGGEYLIYY